ncbi:hypothetical protein BDW75DRAFT_238094 [Aspergillus navahoensis]
MTSFSLKATGAATAVYLLGQQVQCPFIAVPLAADAVAITVALVGSAAASFGGAIAAAQFAKARRVLEGRVQVDGLPSNCMVLSNVFTGDASGGPVPTPCGSACLLYNNLNADQYGEMQSTFNQMVNP